MYLEPDQIDKKTLEISQADDDVYSNMQELGDELPDHAPRFVLMSYPLTLVGPANRLHQVIPCRTSTYENYPVLRPFVRAVCHDILPTRHM